MFIYGILFITLALALLSLVLMLTATGKPFRYGWSRLLLALTLGLFVYLYGTWVYLTVHAKFAFGICLLLCLLSVFFRKKRGAAPRAWKRVLSLVWAGIFILLCTGYFTGTTGLRQQRIELAFPLKTGRYFVLQGGKGLPTNLFHFSLRGAIYAMDIVKLNDWGGRADKIFSRRLEDYEIFNDTIYAPCSGRVVRAYSDNPDNIPPNMDRGPQNTNQVLLETDSSYVFLAHMKKGSVVVHEGQWVQQGQALGCVGNSGFSSEPHLHIQAHAKTTPGSPWYMGEPLYISFNGKGYLLYEVIRPKRVEMVKK
ncbi:M23 family metallopeptidase [Chitinophaga japonensis]|uniref:Peptidase M23-like protein n=1 Tax=Chitinophaga japonensis TaxID=104662 RepID=A0A562T6L8_CHIJA|nr:M23 family metallopeptidase [Chitinophaga japonensis]TWI88918.1 peptidase M23-like protein [Chitinophaga japonensis]